MSQIRIEVKDGYTTVTRPASGKGWFFKNIMPTHWRNVGDTEWQPFRLLLPGPPGDEAEFKSGDYVWRQSAEKFGGAA